MDNSRRTDIVITHNCLLRLGHESRLIGIFLIENAIAVVAHRSGLIRHFAVALHLGAQKHL